MGKGDRVVYRRNEDGVTTYTGVILRLVDGAAIIAADAGGTHKVPLSTIRVAAPREAARHA